MNRNFNKPPIPFSRPTLGPEEEEAALRVIRSGWLTTGAECFQFETEFLESLKLISPLPGNYQAIAVNSATAGLHLALDTLGIGPDDRVAMSTYTFVATAEVVRYQGAWPVFIDIEPGTFHMDLQLLENTLKKYYRSNHPIKAVIAVHISGCSWKILEMQEICRKYKAYLIEDGAHTYPSGLSAGPHGTLSDIGVYSFYANKTITTGEGGMVVTPNQDWAQSLKTKRLHGIDREVWHRYSTKSSGAQYDVTTLGYKYNLPDLAAAIGRVQIGRAMDFLEKRRTIASGYYQGLNDRDWLELPTLGDPWNPSGTEENNKQGNPETKSTFPNHNFTGNSHAWHLFIIKVRLEKLTITRDGFVEKLKERGIMTSLHFIPLHLFSYYKNLTFPGPRFFSPRSQYARSFPTAEDTSNRAISIPIFPGMTEEQVNRVLAELLEIGDTHYRSHG